MRDWLIQGFEYDQWANDRWAPILNGELSNHEAAQRAWAHHLFCCKIWYERTMGEIDLPDLPENVHEALTAMNIAWRELLAISDPTAFVAFQTLSGEHCFLMVEEIARHVVNHGTYHRGELRTYAVQEGIEFPDTDYALWRRHVNPAPA